MCDCEELEYEDFEVMLAAMSKMSLSQMAEAPLEASAPQIIVSRPRT